MKYTFKLSGENLDLSLAEFNSLFNQKAKRDQEIVTAHIDLNPKQILKILNNAALIRSCYEGKRQVWHFQKGKYKGRRPTEKPAFHPTTLKPKLAQALVNISSPKKGIVYDPFCGTGSIVIEASLLNHKALGSDLDWKASQNAKTNLRHYKQKPNLLITNSRFLHRAFKPASIDAIVTDPPYGRSSRIIGKTLYRDFLSSAYEILKPNSKLIIILPKTTKFPKHKFKLINKYDIYVHRSLTRRIYVLKKSK